MSVGVSDAWTELVAGLAAGDVVGVVYYDYVEYEDYEYVEWWYVSSGKL